MSTKENILQLSIDLFSEKGYDAVSMREIAAAVGIKASSLYKHYASKEAILERIFQAYADLMERSNEFDHELFAAEDELTPQVFLSASFQTFKTMILTPQLLKITRIITMEQTRNTSVRDFFYTEMIEKPIEQLTETFIQMQKTGMIGSKDPRMLARTYHAYIIASYYTHNFLMDKIEMEKIEADMLEFIAFFCEELF